MRRTRADLPQDEAEDPRTMASRRWDYRSQRGVPGGTALPGREDRRRGSGIGTAPRIESTIGRRWQRPSTGDAGCGDGRDAAAGGRLRARREQRCRFERGRGRRAAARLRPERPSCHPGVGLEGPRPPAPQPPPCPPARRRAGLRSHRRPGRRRDHRVHRRPQRRAGVLQRVPRRERRRGAARGHPPRGGRVARRGRDRGPDDRRARRRRRAPHRRHRPRRRPAARRRRDLECDESILTGESVPVEKSAAPVATGASVSPAVVVRCSWAPSSTRGPATPSSSPPGGDGVRQDRRRPRRAARRRPSSSSGLRGFSGLLAKVAGVLSVVDLRDQRRPRRARSSTRCCSRWPSRSGITPQLLPAVVSTSLATGSRRLARKKVLVKRLVYIEDLGDIDVLFTDKTGTLTEGPISFAGAIGPAGARRTSPAARAGVQRGRRDRPWRGGGNPLDVALWERPRPPSRSARRTASPRTSASACCPSITSAARLRARRTRDGAQTLVTKGAPEAVLARCVARSRRRRVPRSSASSAPALASSPSPRGRPTARSAIGRRRARPDARRLPGVPRPAQGRRRRPPSPSSRASASRSRSSPATTPSSPTRSVATSGSPSGGTLTGADLDRLDDDALAAAIRRTTIFARVSPDQKSAVLSRSRGARARRWPSSATASTTLSRCIQPTSASRSTSATDVAKDAADIVLLDKDLGVLADGIAEGRRIFANTIKYVLMGDLIELREHVQRRRARRCSCRSCRCSRRRSCSTTSSTTPARWRSRPIASTRRRWPGRPHGTSAFVRRFMSVFGPLSSIFDFVTFSVMLVVLQRERERVPHRLVHRVPRHPDARHLRHPHPAGARSCAAARAGR